MKDKSLFLLCFMILCLSFVVLLAQGRQILRIEEKVDLILENQKSAIVTPTPQKDVE